MKIVQQKSLLTVMVIMGTAFILFSMGCGSSKNAKPALAAAPEAQENNNNKRPTNPTAEADQTPIDQAKDPNKVKECSANEFTDLKTLKTVLADSDQQIKSLGDQKKWTLNSKVLQSAQKSALLCEKLLTRHRPAACKKTIAEDIHTIYSYKKIKSEASTEWLLFIELLEICKTNSLSTEVERELLIHLEGLKTKKVVAGNNLLTKYDPRNFTKVH